jgi:hypothetical protein
VTDTHPFGHLHLCDVACDVNRDEAKLREIDENLARNDLSVLERAALKP